MEIVLSESRVSKDHQGTLNMPELNFQMSIDNLIITKSAYLYNLPKLLVYQMKAKIQICLLQGLHTAIN
jgi:hypothetical protein